MAEPIKATAFEFYVQLVDAANPDSFVINPTIAAGDFKVSTDGGAQANLATLPSVDPAGSTFVRINLDADEMNGDSVNVIGIDAAGDEWQDIGILMSLGAANTDTVNDIIAGDHIESSTQLVVNKRGTSTPVLAKDISGSLLSPSVTVRTVDS